MPALWMPGAVKADVGDHAPTDAQFPPKAIAHITADKEATAAKPVDLVPFAKLKTFFTHGGSGSAPHILWSPFDGSFAQFFPAGSRAKALLDGPGGTRTNRAGKVVIQIEALFFPFCRVDGKVYEKLTDTPVKGWEELNDWVRSWDVPDVWPMGRPKDFTPHRSEQVWETKAGWYGHQNVPENNHVDPGSWPEFAAARADEPFPGTGFFTTNRKSPIIAAMHTRLVAVGCDEYEPGDGANVWGSGDVRSYAAWQRQLGFSGPDADGSPGPASWSKLHVPTV